MDDKNNNNGISFKSSSSSKSLLHEDVIANLNTGMREGFFMDSLSLYQKKINDSMMPELCEWIIKLGHKVKEIDLSWNQITSVGASMLFDTLKINNSSMKTIHLYYNEQIDDKCMKSLGVYIESNKYIEKIIMNNTNISDAGIEILAPYLDGNTTLKILNLDWNKGITDKSKPLLMKIIESSCIESIDIYNTPITQKYTIHTLSACNAVMHGSNGLKLSERYLNDDDLIKICDAMKKYGIDKLKIINITKNEITSKGASVLFDTLKECNSVVSNLYLSENQLDDEFMKQLGEYLQENDYVEDLKLRNDEITDKGIEILSEHLIGNMTLKGLNLNDNKGITDASVPHLIEMVNKSCIISIDVDNTSISFAKQQEIKETFSILIERREIPIKSNTKSAAKISSASI